MAQVKLKLTQTSFPFNFNVLAGTVLVGDAWEQNLQGANAAELEVPQAYFMQNMLPITRGFGSVHYTRVAAEHTYPKYIDKLFQLYDVDGNLALYSTANGACLIYTATLGAWTSFPLPDGAEFGETSVAHLKGTSYVHIAGQGIFVYDFYTNTFDKQTAIGIFPEACDGIVAANQYLILWDKSYIYWSSPLAPLDFTIAQGLGGSSGILANRSRLLQCLPISDGFIAYTTKSAISATYTGNAYYPFKFNEIPNSAGVANTEHVAYDSTNEQHIAWTTSGFQAISIRGAQLVWPELSDAIGSNLFTAAASTGLPYLVFATRLSTKVTAVGNRYIVVSIKRTVQQLNYSHAYVFDLALQRWGRIDVPHVDLFEYRAPEFVANLSYDYLVGSYDDLVGSYDDMVADIQDKTGQFGTTFGVVAANGAIYIALSSTTANLYSMESTSSGAAVPNITLGRYRLRRQAAVTFQNMQLSNNNVNTAEFPISLQVISHDASGNILRSVTPIASLRTPCQYYARLTGAHISLKLTGKLLLTSLEMELSSAGGNILPAAETISVPDDSIVVNSIPVVVSDEFAVVT